MALWKNNVRIARERLASLHALVDFIRSHGGGESAFNAMGHADSVHEWAAAWAEFDPFYYVTRPGTLTATLNALESLLRLRGQALASTSFLRPSLGSMDNAVYDRVNDLCWSTLAESNRVLKDVLDAVDAEGTGIERWLTEMENKPCDAK